MTMTKRNLFDELMELKAERQGKIALKQVSPKQQQSPHGGKLETGVKQTQLPYRITDATG